MGLSMRWQWFFVGAVAVMSTVGAARCALPHTGEAGEVVRPRVPAEEGLLDVHPDGGVPLRRGIPLKPSGEQKRPPCDAELGEEVRHGACYIPVGRRKPPCGKLLEEDGQCFRAVFTPPREPSSLGRE